MNKNELMNLAKGHIQQRVLRDLLNGGTVQLSRYITSQSRYTSYIVSFCNLFSRLEEAGLNIQVTKGQRGGWWTATAKIV